MPEIVIRPLRPDEVPELLAMVRELAEFEDLAGQVVATEAGYREALFGERPSAEALLALDGDTPVGYAVYFTTFSTFRGTAGIWLEDLYVRPSRRRRGIGTRLLQAVRRAAEERNAGRYEWCVLDWNENAIALYKKMGGKVLDEWRIVRIDL